MMKMNKPIVELLAPAGSYETFKAVLHAGADAIYLAGNRYGARAYAGNLSEEELLKAICEAHLFSKRIYLTVNTLVKNAEMGEALIQYIRPLYEAGLDGVIVQDLGVLALFQSVFPKLELHASTQMTITNGDFIPVLKRYGVTRIVPARELSLEEIRQLHKESGLEIESFVHGALCYCYSGDCFMSSFLGGRSGNRGRCAQPCRLEYCLPDSKKKCTCLSLKDLCTLDILPDLIENGVYSMKIEGRMKSTEYAAGITEIYRKYIDLYLEKGREGYCVSEKDRKALLLLFDRGGITEGYYKKHNGADMIALDSKSDKSLEKKSEYEAGVLSRHAMGYERLEVEMTARFCLHEPAQLSLRLKKHPEHTVTVYGEEPQLAMKRAMTKEDFAKQLSKLGNSYYILAEDNALSVELDSGIFVPNGAINELRRKATEALMLSIVGAFYRKEDCYAYEKWDSDGKTKADKRQEDSNNSSDRWISCHVMTYDQGRAFLLEASDKDRLIIDTEFINEQEMEALAQTACLQGVEVFIGLPRITRGNEELHRPKGAVGYLVRSLGQIVKVTATDPTALIVTDYTCYGFNQIAVNEINALSEQVVGQTYSIELHSRELEHLLLPKAELYTYGYLPLMITANCVDKTNGNCHKGQGRITSITDRKGKILACAACCKYCYNLIFNSVPVYLADKKAELQHLQFSYLGVHFTKEKPELVSSVIRSVRNGDAYPGAEFTRGHLIKGVE